MTRRSIGDLMRLNGRSALVTGGAGHIGSAIAEALAEAGARIAIADLPNADMEGRAAAIASSTGIVPTIHPVDLSKEQEVIALPQTVASVMGGVDILVNCAALGGTSVLEGWAEPVEKQGAAAWRKALEVNLTAAFELIQASLPYLRANKNGSIVNVASIYGLVGPDWSLYEGTAMANPAAYGASKGGLLQLTRYLATTLAPDVRVNAICPGGVARGQPQQFVERYEQRTPMRRMATEEDFKGAAVFLASDLSAYVTGHNIVVDGGWCAW